jgi:hypothetical protein
VVERLLQRIDAIGDVMAEHHRPGAAAITGVR